MRDFFLWLLRVSERIFMALLHLLWIIIQEMVRGVGRLCYLILEGIGSGAANLVRSVAPYILAAAALMFVYKYEPKVFASILNLAVVAAGLWIMVKALRPSKRKR